MLKACPRPEWLIQPPDANERNKNENGDPDSRGDGIPGGSINAGAVLEQL